MKDLSYDDGIGGEEEVGPVEAGPAVEALDGLEAARAAPVPPVVHREHQPTRLLHLRLK